eukprot:7007939-Pyramimonas_sp.AAC.1
MTVHCTARSVLYGGRAPVLSDTVRLSDTAGLYCAAEGCSRGWQVSDVHVMVVPVGGLQQGIVNRQFGRTRVEEGVRRCIAHQVRYRTVQYIGSSEETP